MSKLTVQIIIIIILFIILIWMIGIGIVEIFRSNKRIRDEEKSLSKNEYTSINDWYQEIKHLIWPFIIMMVIFTGVLIFFFLLT